jgi:hypothetical protein
LNKTRHLIFDIKVFSPTHRPPLSPEDIPGTHLS